MDSVLYKIIEIEKKAQMINNEGQSARKKLPTEIEGERQRLLELAKVRSEKEIAVTAAQYAKEEQQKNDEIDKREKEQMLNLRVVFEENAAKWENEIYEVIRKK